MPRYVDTLCEECTHAIYLKGNNPTFLRCEYSRKTEPTDDCDEFEPDEE